MPDIYDPALDGDDENGNGTEIPGADNDTLEKLFTFNKGEMDAHEHLTEALHMAWTLKLGRSQRAKLDCRKTGHDRWSPVSVAVDDWWI